MRLIVTEKNNSAKKIAEILSGGTARRTRPTGPLLHLADAEGDHMAIGLKGHVLNPAFPEDYKNWQKTDLHDLIDAKLIKEPTDKNVVKALKKVAKDADDLVIATDFDREGELIGLEALQRDRRRQPRRVGPPRARSDSAGTPASSAPATRR